MTKEEKQILLADLCARLPYGVKIELIWWVMGEGTYINTTLEPDHIEQLLNDEGGDTEIKPYLRPMSSMTEDEKKEYAKLLFADLGGVYEDYYKALDYLHSIHVDYRGLIEKSLAIEAPEWMYKVVEEQQ